MLNDEIVNKYKLHKLHNYATIIIHKLFISSW